MAPTLRLAGLEQRRSRKNRMANGCLPLILCNGLLTLARSWNVRLAEQCFEALHRMRQNIHECRSLALVAFVRVPVVRSILLGQNTCGVFEHAQPEEM